MGGEKERDDRQEKRTSLSRACLRAAHQVEPGQADGYGVRLNGSGLLVTHERDVVGQLCRERRTGAPDLQAAEMLHDGNVLRPRPTGPFHLYFAVLRKINTGSPLLSEEFDLILERHLRVALPESCLLLKVKGCFCRVLLIFFLKLLSFKGEHPVKVKVNVKG
jgi:hypothetical protein